MFLLCSGIYEGYNFTDYTSSVGILPSQAAASSCFQGRTHGAYSKIVLGYHEGNIPWHLIICVNLWRNRIPFIWGFWDATHGLCFHYIIIQSIPLGNKRHMSKSPPTWSRVQSFQSGNPPTSQPVVWCLLPCVKCSKTTFWGARIDQLCLSCLRTVRQLDLHLGQYIFAWQLHPLRCSGWVRWGVRLCWTLMPYMSNLFKSAIVTTGWCDLLQGSFVGFISFRVSRIICVLG